MNILINKLFGPISFLLALLLASFLYFAVSAKGQDTITSSATAEAQIIIAVTNGFVRTYSKYEDEYASGLLPTPAEYRADALHKAGQGDLKISGGTSVVGLPGREIANKAIDVRMEDQLAQLAKATNPNVMEAVFEQNGSINHRSLWPFFATEATCVDCHNRIQNLVGNDQWQLGDLIGAQYVDKDISKQITENNRIAWVMSILVFLTALALSYCCLFLYKQYLLRNDLQVLATTDPMTGCINRREMYERINRLSGSANGALLMLDLDLFKQINDRHGHTVGDAVIKDFSARTKNALRSNDWVARIGGEEFVVWLHGIKPASALLVAERLRKNIETLPLQYKSTEIHYTVSIGLHTVENSEFSQLDSWITKADQHLYRAKNEGRNRIAFDNDAMSSSPI